MDNSALVPKLPPHLGRFACLPARPRWPVFVMKIALFDLDHTLLDGDTNILWIQYLTQQQLVPAETVARQQAYMDLYAQERLDMAEYMDFHMDILRTRSMAHWQPIVAQFVQSQLVPRLAPEALRTVQAHRDAGHRVALVTATNSVLASGLGQALDLHTIATEIEIADGQVTGRTVGLPSFREHKIDRVQAWLGLPLSSPSISESHFYSDSANDIPLLNRVSHPVAVNADAKLHAVAQQRHWPQRSWKAA